MLPELATSQKVVGVKQARRALREGRVLRIFLACDADPALTGPLRQECAAKGVPVEDGASMIQLGKACGISVGASVAALLRES